MLKQAACLVVGSVAVGSFAFLLGCEPLGRAWGLCGGSGLDACLLVGLLVPGALAVVGPARVCLLDLFCSGVWLSLLLSHSHCFVSFLCLGLCVLGDGTLMGWGSFVLAWHLCVLVHVRLGVGLAHRGAGLGPTVEYFC